MQTFIADIIPKIQQFSQKLDDLTLLTNQHWVVIDNINSNKTVYIFRSNSELLISSNGDVEKGKWEYLGNNSLLIDKNTKSYLFKHGFFDANVLALKIDGKDEYAFLINENRYEGELSSLDKVIDFLNRKYINPEIQNSINNKYEINKPTIIIGKTKEQLIKENEEVQKQQDKDMVIALSLIAVVTLMIFLGLIL